MDRDVIVFMVRRVGGSAFFTTAFNREGAKRNAEPWFGGNPDEYVVTPLTKPGENIKFDLAVRV